MKKPNPLGPGWEAEFESEWNRAFTPDSPNPKIPRQTRSKYSFKLEDVVRAAMAELRKELGKAWLPNPIYGTKLHAAVRQQIEKMTPSSRWQIEAEHPLRSFAGIPAALLDVRVGDYLGGAGQHLSWLRPHLSAVLETSIGDIKPDLFIRAPDGVVTIWDLPSREREEHVAKTILYANLLTGDNELARVGETYWLQFR